MRDHQDKVGQQVGTAQNNPGNFANDREKASEAGHKGGQASGGNLANDPNGHLKTAKKAVKCPGRNLRIRKQGKAAAVSLRKTILSVPVAQVNAVVKEDMSLAAKLTGSKAWMKGRKKTAG